jgi:hypothetical protein
MRRTGLVIVGIITFCATMVAQEDVLRPSGRRQGRTQQDTAQNPQVASGRDSLPSFRWRLALEGGANLSFLTRSTQGLSATSPATVYNDGHGWAALGGITLDLHLGSIFHVGLRTLVEGVSISNTAPDVTAEAAVVDPVTMMMIGYTTVGLDATYASEVMMVTLAPYLCIQPLQWLRFSVGPVIQMPTGPVRRTSTQSIDDGQAFRFWDGTTFSTERTVSDEEDVTPAPRYGLDMAIACPIGITSWMEIWPRVGLQWMFSSFTAGTSALDASRAYSVGPVPYTADPSRLSAVQASVLVMILL